jgi:nucleoside-diphosphate-sugar epimerase
MRSLVARASGAIGTRLVPQLIDHGHKVTGTYRSRRNGEGLGAGPLALGQQPTGVWRRIAGVS